MTSYPYVALGDSYAAGVGAGPARDDCWRADGGYPVLVARALGVDVAYNACIGGTVADVLDHQLVGLGPATRWVSISVGGNDADFVPVVIEAAKPEWAADLDAVLEPALATVRDELPGRLDDLFARVRALAPSATLLVTGYPALFCGVDCNLATFFSATDMQRLDAAGRALVQCVAAAAGRAGAVFLDVAGAFAGHGICSGKEWLNGLSWPIEASFHPNPEGHAVYARLVTEAIQTARTAGVGDGGIEQGADGVQGRTGEGSDAVEGGGIEGRVVRGPEVRGSAPTFADWPLYLR